MRVYVANASRQVHLFQYRIPESPQLRHREIPALGQSVLPDDFNQPQIDYLVEKMGPYGFVSTDDVRNRRHGKFTRLVYSVDRPVSENVIMALFTGNQDSLKDAAEQTRREIAYQTDRQITEDVQHQREADAPAVRDLQFEIEEVEPDRGFERPDKEVMNVVYQVENQPDQAPRRGRGRPRKG